MKVGDLVKMVGDPHNIPGLITELLYDAHRNNRAYYKVNWLDDLCDSSYADADMLEVISEMSK
tara:strand:+ start:192 stop:380 length:189 start_codon:yes stop_codon:yes gene_type:complete